MDYSINQRIKQLIEALNDSNSTFARRIGLLQPESIRLLVNNKRPVPRKTLQQIAEKLPNVNIEWLKTGKGQMFKNELAKEESALIGETFPLYGNKKEFPENQKENKDLSLALAEARARIEILEKENSWLRRIVETMLGSIPKR